MTIKLAVLDSAAPVVRGGSNRDPVALVRAVEHALRHAGKPVLSVFIVEPDDGDVGAAVVEACRQGPVVHGSVQIASVGRLIDAGFLIADERSGDESHCHYHVYFSEPVTELQAEAWLAAFGEPQPNPAKERP